MNVPFDLFQLIETIGYLGIFGIVAAESGLFFGFVLPGESLLFSAGIVAAQGLMSLWVLLPAVILAAVLGDSMGYWTGKKLGGWLLRQPDSFFFKKHHVYLAQRFYAKHGGKAVILARFVPTVRTFAPIAAGISGMPYRLFFVWSVTGSFLWAGGVTVLGYFLGTLIPDINGYLLPALGVLLLASMIPSLIHLYRDNQRKESIWSRVRGFLSSVFH